MATAASSGPRTEFFKQLKAICVPLSQLVLRAQDPASDAKETLRLLDSLVNTWTAQVSKDASILDEKLAAYVFFPLSHLLRKQDKYPVRVIEAVIRLLRTLIQDGWKAKIEQDLSHQLLLFLSFTIGGAPGQTERRDLPEETIIEGYRTLTALTSTLGLSLSLPAAPRLDDRVIPALGHSVTVMLDSITVGVPALIQLEALRCLQAVYAEISDSGLLAQFLPGTVSCLSKILSPPQQQKTQRRVLTSALEVLQVVLTTSIGDIKVRGLLKKLGTGPESEKTPSVSEEDGKKLRVELSPAWLKATTAQVKIALSAVLKLRNHESEEVQSALDKLCIALLDECHASLVDCQGILVESAMMLEEEETTRPTIETSLQDLVSIYPELGESVKSALYSWVTGLPRVMQLNDERIKQLAVRNILRGTKHAASLHLDSSTLDDSLGDALRDSVVALIKGSKAPKVRESEGTDVILSADSGLERASLGMDAYRPVVLDLQAQKSTREDIMTLISNVSSPAQQVKLATTMLAYVQDSDGVDQVASYWLAFELIKSSYAGSSDLDELFDLSSLDETKGQEEAFQELYDFSASVLSSHSDSEDVDWRLEAIALEVAAFASSRQKTDFRVELVDVLYPVATFLGSQTPQLRSHAIATLNIMAASCGYGSVSELIVDNADYMVNSVSLRLNTFDISPASTKVLTMLIRLTGPRLVPFLDDVIAAIFAALDNYHGYPVFVQNLFSVLSEVVSQGVKSDTLLIEDGKTKTVHHKKRPPPRQGITGILINLQKRSDRAKDIDEEQDDEMPKSHPKEPWGPEKSQAKSLLDVLENPDEDEENHEPPPEEKKTPSTPTYTLLTRILSLTQHYLTSPTPILRKTLLDLIGTVSPALAPDEDAFLPLVNAVWPVIITRLQDSEPFVAIAACKALSGLCSAAGDFLSSRFKTEWHEGLYKWLSRVRRDAEEARGGRGSGGGRSVQVTGLLGRSLPPRPEILISGRRNSEAEGLLVRSSGAVTPSESSSGGGLGKFALASQVWDAAVELLKAIVSYVRIDEDMFDEVLGLLGDVMVRDKGVREALEAVNADAVWLVLWEQGVVDLGKGTPLVDGVVFAGVGPRGVVEVGA
ncbi:armadillo-type protein [Podospora aff. communis PSN243]|uniref:Armadillo-type protein n=1 Tax=Podospora aff. communis PSN243 TaxID=3040156 RepID=A0AAV9H8E5_9PEZI|nr:armadillo-type protein [Podospora aff. communis PSN243]